MLNAKSCHESYQSKCPSLEVLLPLQHKLSSFLHFSDRRRRLLSPPLLEDSPIYNGVSLFTLGRSTFRKPGNHFTLCFTNIVCFLPQHQLRISASLLGTQKNSAWISSWSFSSWPKKMNINHCQDQASIITITSVQSVSKLFCSSGLGFINYTIYTTL